MTVGTFWVIFDTCTRPEYYQDVHNLLALPKGGILRYNYREKYLSRRALELSAAMEDVPRDVLLVYGEYEGMKQGVNPKSFALDGKRHWIATRFAEVINIEQVADDYFYDLRVGAYPYPDKLALFRVVDSLDKAGEAPFRKWVSISSEEPAWRVLSREADDDNKWADIVDLFHGLPTQFVGDSFWRVRSIDGKGGEPLPMRSDTIRPSKGKASQRPTSYVSLKDGDSVVLHFQNREPKPNVPPKKREEAIDLEGVSRTNRNLLIDDGNSPVKIAGADRAHMLRQYYVWDVRGSTERSASILERRGTMALWTDPIPDQFPVGPKFDLAFRVRKSYVDISLAVVLVLVAAGAGLAAKEFWKADIVLALVCAFAAAASGLMIAVILGGYLRGSAKPE